MKSIRITKISTMLWVIGFIAYNTYFGWNKLPLSELETTFNGVFRVWMTFNIGNYLFPLFKRYEKWIEKEEKSDRIKERDSSQSLYDNF